MSPWRDEYPDPEVTAAVIAVQPTQMLIDAAAYVAMLVVGASGEVLPGLRLGSVSHAGDQ